MLDRLSPFVRIGLRIFGGFAMGRGYLDDGTATMLYSDPEIIGAVCLAVSEGWYFLAKKFGWVK
jgi:hypothetical protein